MQAHSQRNYEIVNIANGLQISKGDQRNYWAVEKYSINTSKVVATQETITISTQKDTKCTLIDIRN